MAEKVKITQEVLDLLAFKQRCTFKDEFVNEFASILINNFKWNDRAYAIVTSVSLWESYRKGGFVYMYQSTLGYLDKYVKEKEDVQQALVLFLNKAQGGYMKVELTCRIEYYAVDLGDERNLVLEVTFHPEQDYTKFELLEDGVGKNDLELKNAVLDKLGYEH